MIKGMEARGEIFEKQIDKIFTASREEELEVKQESIISSLGNKIL